MININSLTPREIAAEALRLRDQDDPERAVELLSGAVARYSGEALLWQTLGLVQRARQESAAAMEALQKASSLAPSDGKIAAALAYVTLEAGLPAVALFDRAAGLMQRDLGVRIGRSAAQLAAGEVDAAIADLSDACRAQPLWLEGHAALADLHWLLGHEGEFANSYSQALARNSHALPLWLALIDRYQKVGRYDWALQATDTARRIMGEKVEFAPVRATCASELGAHQAADVLFDQLMAVPVLRQNVPLMVQYVRHLLRCNRPDKAAEQAMTVIHSPEANQIWPYVATCWRILGDQRWAWLERDDRLVKTVKLYEPAELLPLADSLRRLHNLRHAPAGQSVRLGTQTDGPLFARIEPEIRQLRRRIEKAVTEHISSLGAPDPGHPTLARWPTKVRFAGSWSVRLLGEGHHSNHIHPQGWLSSVFYVAVPAAENMGPPPAGFLQLGVPPGELGLKLEPSKLIAPEAGWLTLFPSTMWHGTVPISGGERLSVAFDIRPQKS